MRLFNRKKQLDTKGHINIEPAPPTSEIVENKEVVKTEVQKAKDANKNFKQIFERNHFSVKLYVAAGGSLPKANKTQKV